MATKNASAQKHNLKDSMVAAGIIGKKAAGTGKSQVKVDKPAINETNKDVHVQQAISRRVLKYIYPKDCLTAEKRKAYRAKVRAQIEKLEASIGKVKGEARLKAKEELQNYRSLHMA
jgi:hypothetical protein